jgi:hypothetical protein
MGAPSNKTKIAIMKVLAESGRPMGGSLIESALQAKGYEIRERTVRAYLLQLDKEGFTSLVGRRHGRQITEKGRLELARSNVVEKVGIVSAKVDTLGYRMTFRCKIGTGSVIMNVCLIKAEDLPNALKEITSVFSRGYTMSYKIVIAKGGELFGGMLIPEKSVAIGTVCSVTINGILLHEGVPVNSRFGGLLEMSDSKPVRFVELIEYRGSTLDPMEIFIKADMTNVRDLVRTGKGVVCVSFREVPSIAVDDIWRIEKNMKRHGLGGILAIGRPNQPLLDIPVSQGYSGMLVMGGLNPVAAIHEAGIQTSIWSLANLIDYSEFHTLDELRRLKKLPG